MPRDPIIRFLPFTTALTATIALVGALNGAAHHRVDASVLQTFGYATQDLWSGRAWSMVTAIFLTDRPLMYWGILGFAVAVVGTYEYLAGPRRAALVFFGCDLLANLALSLFVVLPSFLMGTQFGLRWLGEHDVGMSAGGFALLGALISRAPEALRGRLVAALIVCVAAKIIFYKFDPLSDMVHAIAAPLGFWADRSLCARDRENAP